MSECLNKEVFDSDQRSAVLKGWPGCVSRRPSTSTSVVSWLLG